MISENLFKKLACPDCKRDIVLVNSSLACSNCGKEFPVIGNGTIPVMFSTGSDFADSKVNQWELTNVKNIEVKDYRKSRLLPRTNVTNLAKKKKKTIFSHMKDGDILNIGSGQERFHHHQNVTNLDITPHNNSDIIADSHCLPFKDNCFDFVYSNSVFEHLKKPFVVAKEINRILRKGGMMWCDAPLIYPVHGVPYDYFRYTPDGLKSLFNDMECVEIGASLGPFAAIATYTERIADVIWPTRTGFMFRWILAWCLHPLKYLDPWVVKKDPINCGASFYIVCKKIKTKVVYGK
jgi:SAM-dependent methyltransferase